MSHVIAATFEDGVFKPDEEPGLPEHTRVRLHIEDIAHDADRAGQEQAWAILKQLWQNSTFNSHGDRLSRDELHERR
jgi:predicted DNA-binding antitoxin AbrB/MazE fold protein